MSEHVRHRVLPSDRGAVRGLLEAFGGFRQREIDTVEEQLRQHLAHGDSSPYRLAFVEKESRLAGYICFGPVEVTEGSWILHGIAIHPDFQRQGCGVQLLQYAEKRLASAAGSRLFAPVSSRPEFQPTRDFLVRANFSQEATLKDFYAPGEDQLVFVKRFR